MFVLSVICLLHGISDISELCELVYQVLWTNVLIYRICFNVIINACLDLL